MPGQFNARLDGATSESASATPGRLAPRLEPIQPTNAARARAARSVVSGTSKRADLDGVFIAERGDVVQAGGVSLVVEVTPHDIVRIFLERFDQPLRAALFDVLDAKALAIANQINGDGRECFGLAHLESGQGPADHRTVACVGAGDTPQRVEEQQEQHAGDRRARQNGAEASHIELYSFGG